jgi:hypothetical protein
MLKLKPSIDRWSLDIVLIRHRPNDVVDPTMFNTTLEYAPV